MGCWWGGGTPPCQVSYTLDQETMATHRCSPPEHGSDIRQSPAYTCSSGPSGRWYASADGCILLVEIQVGVKTYLRPVARLVKLLAFPCDNIDPATSVARYLFCFDNQCCSGGCCSKLSIIIYSGTLDSPRRVVGSYLWSLCGLLVTEQLGVPLRRMRLWRKWLVNKPFCYSSVNSFNYHSFIQLSFVIHSSVLTQQIINYNCSLVCLYSFTKVVPAFNYNSLFAILRNTIDLF